MKKKLAQFASSVFDPRVEIPLMLIVAVVNGYRNGAELVFLGLLLFIDAVLPLWFYIHLRRKKEISDWDMTRRQERLPLFAFTTLAHLGGVGLAVAFGQIELAKVLTVFWLLAAMFTMVTWVGKVSLHVGVNAAFITYLSLITSMKVVWLFLVVILVAWSRLELKKHGKVQVLMGGLLGMLGVLGGMKVMGM